MSGAVGGMALLPCPFCGGDPITEVSGTSNDGMMISCMNSKCVGPHCSYIPPSAAIAAWNTRTTPPARSYADEAGVLQMDREAFARLEDHEPGSMGWRMITEPTRGDCVGVQAFAAHRRAAIRLLSQEPRT